MADKAAILCVSVKDDPEVVEGSRQEFCELCAEPVWLAPSSFMWREQGASIFCNPCGFGIMQTEESQLVMPTREQYDEMRDHYRKKHAQ